jgi:hypothetical protein
MSSSRLLRRLLPVVISVALGGMGLVVSTAPVLAQPIYRIWMSGAEVVPPTPGDYCSIEALFYSSGNYWSCDDTPDRLLTLTSLYNGLSGPPTGCYMHRGAPGINGKRLYTIHAGFFPPIYAQASIAINPADCADLDNNNLYIVITTELYPDGEVRGQVIYDYMGAVESSTWGHIKAVYR